MTPEAADGLARRIINCWRGGPPLAEWVQALLPLDEGTAGTAFIRLQRTLEHAPTIAKFIATCNSLHTATNDPYRSEPKCPRCDDNGSIGVWLTTHPVKGTRLQYPYRFAFCCPNCRGAHWLAPPPNGLPATAYDPEMPPLEPQGEAA